MSHLRVSKKGECSPLIPRARAHMVVSLEPVEAIRVLKTYGNPDVKVITNMRPVRPAGVISGEQEYPDKKTIEKSIKELSSQAWFLDTTKAAAELGNPVFSNVMLVGALSKAGDLFIDENTFEKVLRDRMPANKIKINLKAFSLGRQMIKTGA